MLFDPRPKSRREGQFNRREELEVLHANRDAPITIIIGIRRIDKTSLLNVFLSELEFPSIVLPEGSKEQLRREGPIRAPV